jgi:hypothetical protein
MTACGRSSLLLVLALASCSGEPAESEPTGDADVAADSAPADPGRFFERSIVFLTTRPDSVLIVPWLISARTLPGGVQREVRGLLARGDTWEEFFADQWESPPTRLPWNPLPRGRMRLVVGDLDALEQVLFDEGPRQLGVQLLQPRAEWSGPRGESFRLLDGALMMASARVPGVVLDVTRGRPLREGQGGDWAVLYAGDVLQMVLHAPTFQPPGTSGAFHAWARVDDAEQVWPEVTVDWSERTSFERARREIPVVWSAAAAGGEMSADLTVHAAHIQAGEGEGPQLPVDAFFQVEGTVRIGEAVHRVRGLLRHTQP